MLISQNGNPVSAPLIAHRRRSFEKAIFERAFVEHEKRSSLTVRAYNALFSLLAQGPFYDRLRLRAGIIRIMWAERYLCASLI